MPRGGRRQGKPGQGYSNRTDLLTKPRLPATAAPGQPYGQAGQQLAAQKAVPMGTPPVPTPQQPPDQPPQQYTAPEDVPNLNDPTSRPAEPLTHGLPVGPGGGPEVLSPNAMGVGAQYSNAHQLLTSLAQTSGSPSLNTLLANVQGGL